MTRIKLCDGVSLDLIMIIDYKMDDRPASSLIAGAGETETGENLHGRWQGGLDLTIYSTKCEIVSSYVI
jgi:hypothetical protein